MSKTNYGAVTEIKGEVKAYSEEGTRILKVGDYVFSNETIITNANSSVTLFVSKNESKTIGADQTLKLGDDAPAVIVVKECPPELMKECPAVDPSKTMAPAAAGPEPAKVPCEEKKVEEINPEKLPAPAAGPTGETTVLVGNEGDNGFGIIGFHPRKGDVFGRKSTLPPEHDTHKDIPINYQVPKTPEVPKVPEKCFVEIRNVELTCDETPGENGHHGFPYDVNGIVSLLFPDQEVPEVCDPCAHTFAVDFVEGKVAKLTLNQIVDGTDSGLTSDGQAILLYNGPAGTNSVIGKTECGDVIFATQVVFDANAKQFTVVFLQMDAIDHPDACNPNDVVVLQGLSVTLTNDCSTAVASIKINILDDGPSTCDACIQHDETNGIGVVGCDVQGSDETCQPLPQELQCRIDANNSQNSEEECENNCGQPIAIMGVAKSEIDYSFGKDGAGHVALTDSDGCAYNGTASGMTDTATGECILLYSVSDTLVEGRVADCNGAVAFYIYLGDSWTAEGSDCCTNSTEQDVWFVQVRAIAHPDTCSVDETVVTDSVFYTVTDNDGDKSTSEINISIQDDGPSVQPVCAGSIDQATLCDDVANNSELCGVIPVSSGVDGGKFTDISLHCPDLTSHGNPVEFGDAKEVCINGENFLVLTGTVTGENCETSDVLTVTLNTCSGEYNIELLNKVDVCDNLTVKMDYTFTDGDGDAVSAELKFDLVGETGHEPPACEPPACDPPVVCEPPVCEEPPACEPPACDPRVVCQPPVCEPPKPCEKPPVCHEKPEWQKCDDRQEVRHCEVAIAVCAVKPENHCDDKPPVQQECEKPPVVCHEKPEEPKCDDKPVEKPCEPTPPVCHDKPEAPKCEPKPECDKPVVACKDEHEDKKCDDKPQHKPECEKPVVVCQPKPEVKCDDKKDDHRDERKEVKCKDDSRNDRHDDNDKCKEDKHENDKGHDKVGEKACDTLSMADKHFELNFDKLKDCKVEKVEKCDDAKSDGRATLNIKDLFKMSSDHKLNLDNGHENNNKHEDNSHKNQGHHSQHENVNYAQFGHGEQHANLHEQVQVQAQAHV